MRLTVPMQESSARADDGQLNDRDRREPGCLEREAAHGIHGLPDALLDEPRTRTRRRAPREIQGSARRKHHHRHKARIYRIRIHWAICKSLLRRSRRNKTVTMGLMK
jgi:hypothetical protein